MFYFTSSKFVLDIGIIYLLLFSNALEEKLIRQIMYVLKGWFVEYTNHSALMVGKYWKDVCVGWGKSHDDQAINQEQVSGTSQMFSPVHSPVAWCLTDSLLRGIFGADVAIGFHAKAHSMTFAYGCGMASLSSQTEHPIILDVVRVMWGGLGTVMCLHGPVVSSLCPQGDESQLEHISIHWIVCNDSGLGWPTLIRV